MSPNSSSGLSSQPAVFRPEGAPAIAAAGDTYRMMVDGRHTGGQFTLIEIRVLPGGGPPPHVHRREDETFFVIEGDLQLWVDGKTIDAPAGTCVFAPRGIPHRFTNASSKPTRFLLIASPSGFEDFLQSFATPVASLESTPPPVTPELIQTLLAVAPKYGIEILPPPSGHAH